MKECGYKITAEIVSQNVEYKPDPASPINMLMDCDSLAAYYKRIGLTVKRQFPTNEDESEGTGGTSPVACKICGPMKDQAWYKKGVKFLACDPEKHAAFYDAFNGGN